MFLYASGVNREGGAKAYWHRGEKLCRPISPDWDSEYGPSAGTTVNSTYVYPWVGDVCGLWIYQWECNLIFSKYIVFLPWSSAISNGNLNTKFFLFILSVILPKHSIISLFVYTRIFFTCIIFIYSSSLKLFEKNLNK